MNSRDPSRPYPGGQACKATAAQIRAARVLVRLGFSQKVVAAKLGLPASVVNTALRGETYQWVTDEA